MVQRKVANKVGIQGDHDKATDKRLGNSKPEILSQYQDGKNRGGHDFKKVLKKSRSIKLSDKESSRSSPALKPDKSLPGKPPTTTAALDKISAKAAAMQPKQSLVIKTSVGSANYMKSTSSSNARMDSAKAIQTSSSNNKSSSQQKSTKTPSLKPMKALTRTPSLKLARGLKKIPSFKHVRLVAKKGSKAAVCADIDVQRATCSSTLKDSKFPGYLMLNPGGTELDGTSVFKVCTYKYCSLNGHFHTPLPPLKAFMSAKRRLLKAEKVMKLEALSPRANKSKDRPSSQEDDHVQIKDGGMEFFIEVYDGSCMNKDVEDQEPIDCMVKMEAFDDLMMLSIGNLADGRTGEYDEQDAESVSNRSPHFEIDYDDDHLDQQFDTVSTGINSSKFFHQESVDEDGDEEEEQQHPRVEINEPDCDAFEVEWEEGQHIEPSFDNEGSNEFELEHLLQLEESPVKSEYQLLDDGSSNCFEEIVADEVVQDELDLDLDLEVSYVPDSNMDEQLPFSPSEELTTAPTDELNSSEIDSALMEGPRGEVNVSSDEQNACFIVKNEILSIIGPAPEDDDTNCSAVESDDPSFVNDQENVIETNAEAVLAYEEKAIIEKVCEQTRFEEQQIDGTVEMNGVTDVEAVHTCEEEVIIDEVCEQTHLEEQQIDGTAENDGVTEVEADESLVTTGIVLEEQIPNTETEDAIEKINNHDETESVSTMPTTDPTQDFSESALEYSVADDNEAIPDCHDDANREDSELKQDDVIEDNGKSEAAQICLSADTLPSAKATFYTRVKVNAEEQPETCINLKLTIGSKKLFPDGAEERNFNPHEPNYLPLIPDPEAEKVDLRHQTEEERKNAEEWMLDYALRQAVTKLTPARSKRVALLVEAFETVKPKPKFETNQRHTSETFAGVRPLQTCI